MFYVSPSYQNLICSAYQIWVCSRRFLRLEQTTNLIRGSKKIWYARGAKSDTWEQIFFDPPVCSTFGSHPLFYPNFLGLNRIWKNGVFKKFDFTKIIIYLLLARFIHYIWYQSLPWDCGLIIKTFNMSFDWRNRDENICTQQGSINLERISEKWTPIDNQLANLPSE